MDQWYTFGSCLCSFNFGMRARVVTCAPYDTFNKPIHTKVLLPDFARSPGTYMGLRAEEDTVLLCFENTSELAQRFIEQRLKEFPRIAVLGTSLGKYGNRFEVIQSQRPSLPAGSHLTVEPIILTNALRF